MCFVGSAVALRHVADALPPLSAAPYLTVADALYLLAAAPYLIDAFATKRYLLACYLNNKYRRAFEETHRKDAQMDWSQLDRFPCYLNNMYCHLFEEH